MKLGEIIAKIDRSKLEDYYGVDELMDVFGFGGCYFDTNNTGFEHYYISPTLDTDSWVGISVIFLKGEPVGISKQTGRKTSAEFMWIADAVDIDTVRKHLLSLILSNNDTPDTISLDEEFGLGYRTHYSSEILTHLVPEVWHQGTLRPIVKTYGYRTEKDYKKWSTIDIDIDGTTTNVPMSEVLMPWVV